MSGTARTRQNRTRGMKWLRQRDKPMSRWQLSLVLAVVVGVFGAVATLAVRTARGHDALVPWRRALSANRSGPTWPAWDPAWFSPPEPPGQRVVELGDVRGAYAYAAEHADVLRNIPCYCGRAREGHQSNLDCYIRDRTSTGQPIWTDHTLTCPMCVNITCEVALMLEDGKTVREAREAIDAHYGPYYRTRTPTPQPR